MATIGIRDTDAAPPPASGADGASWFRPRLAWYAVIMVSLVTVFGQLDRGIMALLLASIKRDTGMSDTQLSLLMGLAYSLVYMLAGLPMARLADARTRTRILPGALAVWSLGTALCGIAGNFWQFFVYRGLVGGGEAVKGPTSTSLIADLVPREHLARAFGVYNLAISAGEALALIIGGALIALFAGMTPVELPGLGELHGWRMVYLVFGLPGILFALVFLATVPEPSRKGRRHAGSAPIAAVVRFFARGPESKVLLPMFFSAATMSIFALGNLSWRPTFYERTYGLSAADYGRIGGTLSLLTAPIGIAIGTLLVERMARRWDDAPMRLVLACQAAMVPLAILFPLMPRFELALGCQMLFNIVMVASTPALQASQQLITPNEMRGQINAVFMFTIGVIGTAIGPTAVALLTDYVFREESQLRYAMTTAAAVATPIMLVCTALAFRHYGPLFRAAEQR